MKTGYADRAQQEFAPPDVAHALVLAALKIRVRFNNIILECGFYGEREEKCKKYSIREGSCDPDNTDNESTRRMHSDSGARGR